MGRFFVAVQVADVACALAFSTLLLQGNEFAVGCSIPSIGFSWVFPRNDKMRDIATAAVVVSNFMLVCFLMSLAHKHLKVKRKSHWLCRPVISILEELPLCAVLVFFFASGGSAGGAVSGGSCDTPFVVGAVSLVLATVMLLIKSVIILVKYVLTGWIAFTLVKKYAPASLAPGARNEAASCGDKIMRLFHWLLHAGKLAVHLTYSLRW